MSLLRKILTLVGLLLVASVGVQANQRAYGFCTAGGQAIVVVGLNGTPEAQSNYPGCTVTVFLAGTTNLATIFKDNLGTALGNPFTGDSITGYWEFYAANGRYDVLLTGAGIANPGFTFGDILLSDTGGGAGASAGSYATYTFSVTAGIITATANPISGLPNFSGTDSCTVVNNALGQMQNLGGTLLFKNGTYNMSVPVQESIAGYSHFYCIGIPSTAAVSYPQFNFVGESSNLGNQNGVLNNSPSPNGVIFNVTTAAETVAGTNQLAAFWMRPNNVILAGTNRWNNPVFFQNLSVQFQNNQHGKEIHFYMLEAGYASFINCSADYVTSPTALSAAGNIGYVSPGTPSDGSYFRNVYTTGPETGFSINGEHAHLETTQAFHATLGYWYGQFVRVGGTNIIHPSEFIHMIVYDCLNGIKLGPNINAGSLVNMYGLDFEFAPGGNWGFSTGIVETTNGITGGTITYEGIQTNFGIFTFANVFQNGSGKSYVVYQQATHPNGTVTTSSTSVSTTGTTKQTLISYTVFSNTLLFNSYNNNNDGGDYIKIEAWGTTAANGNTKTFEIDWNGTTIASVTSTANNGAIRLEARIMTSGTGNAAQEIIGWGDDGATHTVTRTLGAVNTNSTSPTIIAAATTPTASGDFTFRGWTVEYMVGTH